MTAQTVEERLEAVASFGMTACDAGAALGARLCLCGAALDDVVFHDDTDDGRQTCEKCCESCRDERNNEQ